MKPSRPHGRSFVVIFFLISVLAWLPVAAQEGGVPAAVKARPLPVGQYYALLIGNNAYKRVRSLKTAEDDAREVDRVLRSYYGFRTRLLLNATRQQIISTLNAYRRELDADSSLLIYYAGHGYNDREADKAYWWPVDAEQDDNSNWISADDITTNVKTIPAKHVLIVSDSCYSGTLTRGLGDAFLGRPTARQRYLEKMLAGKSRTLMASGGNEPVADDGGGKHSVFAKALLRGLTTIDKEQFTADELFRAYVQESVAGGANQTPEYSALRNSGHDSGDFVFVRGGGKGGAVAAAPGVNPNPTSTAPPAAPIQTTGAADAADPRGRSAAPTEGAGSVESQLVGTTWVGSSPEAGQYQVEFLKDGQLNYVINVRQNGVTSPKTVKGKWRQSGNNVQIIIGDYYSVWQGQIDGSTMKGEGSNQEGVKWNWSLFKKG
ncbi:MAG TPA: caspase family protein [Pyrinomonadaceae bacterium]|jgi:uncharacterized caspase-like protein|nr:caspase family protein [Pyrinomonadaceae bacterium]